MVEEVTSLQAGQPIVVSQETARCPPGVCEAAQYQKGVLYPVLGQTAGFPRECSWTEEGWMLEPL